MIQQIATADFSPDLCLFRLVQPSYSRRVVLAAAPTSRILLATSSLGMPRHTRNYRLSVAARLVLAVAGGYILTSEVVAALALLLPLQPAEATLAATMLSFAIYAGIVLITFAIRSIWRVGTCMALAIAVARAIAWTLDA